MFERSLRVFLAATLTLAGPRFAAASAPASPTSSPSSAEPLGEIRLKSGGFVRGQIVEYMPGEYVIVVPVGKSETRRFEWAEVEEVVMPGSTAPSTSPAPGGVPGGVPGGIPGGIPGGVPNSAPVDAPAPTPAASAEASVTPSPSQPLVIVEQVKGKNPVALYRIESEGVGHGAGVTIRMIRYSEICQAPCAGLLERKSGEFFVSGRGYGPSKRFRLEGTSSTYSLRVTPRPKALVWLGYLTMLGFISGGVAVALVPSFVDMPKPVAPRFYAGGAVIGALGLAGGITMIAFSRTKVEVLPERPR